MKAGSLGSHSPVGSLVPGKEARGSYRKERGKRKEKEHTGKEKSRENSKSVL